MSNLVDARRIWELGRAKMRADPWYFGKYVCGHGEKSIERIHRPLAYLYTRHVPMLVAILREGRLASPIIEDLRADFLRHEINIDSDDCLPKVKRRLRRINVRLPRGSGKSVGADDADLWEAVMDPNIRISLGSKADPFVQDRIRKMGDVVMSPAFGYWFPERVPDDPKTDVTRDSIKLKGRTIAETEATIEGRGVTSQWAGRHYNKNRRDDMVGTESGEASLEDALRHVADIPALRDKIDWRGDLFIGTVTGENDDHSLLLEDDDVLTISMPMEVHEGGTTLENVFDDGELTMPEWEGFSRDGVDTLKKEARTSTTHGPVYLLQNFYMVAHKSGTSLFTKRMLDRSLFRKLTDKETMKTLVLRPKKGLIKQCYAQWPTQGEMKKVNFDDWFIIDPSTLPYSAWGIAGDQSVTQDKSGDEWSLGSVFMDWEGTFYLWDVIKGRGYQNFISALAPFDRANGGCNAKIGLDANATQGMTIEWIKRSEEFRSMSRRVVPVRSGEAKDVNIRNFVQARMLSEGLYINPDLPDYHSELLRYRPRMADGRKRRTAVDNQLDVTWMAMTLPTPPSAPIDEETMALESMMAAQGDRRDPVTNVSAGNWMDAIDWS